jgi:hypothetical protein
MAWAKLAGFLAVMQESVALQIPEIPLWILAPLPDRQLTVQSMQQEIRVSTLYPPGLISIKMKQPLFYAT